MFLRLLLIGVVGSLGIDWSRCPLSGRGCPASRAERAIAPAALIEPKGAINEAMPTGLDAFAVEPDPVPAPPPVLVEAQDLPAEVDPDLASRAAPVADADADADAAFGAMMEELVASFRLDSGTPAEGLAKNAGAAELVPGVEAEAEAAVFSLAESFGTEDVASSEPVLGAPLPTPRFSRLAVAVRLTGEAVQAWLRLLEGPELACDGGAGRSRH